MDRFKPSSSDLVFAECELWRQKGVVLYDGDSKNPLENDGGCLVLTNKRLVWIPVNEHRSSLAVALSLVVLAETIDSSLFHSAKIRLTLSGASSSSRYNHVRLSFRSGGASEMHAQLMTALERADWRRTEGFAAIPTTQTSSGGGQRNYRAGIVGIEKKIAAEHTNKQQEISDAFADLTRLMETARRMVALSRQLSEQMCEKRGAISDDETVQLQAHLLSLGVEDPVTKQSSSNFHQQLARQLATSLEPAVRQAGGLITLTDAYCRINRARGLELLSPDDLLSACRLMQPPGTWPLHCRTLSSGVRVLQLPQLDESCVLEDTAQRLKRAAGGVTSERLAALAGVPVLLADQWLRTAELRGLACRDDSPEGLVFFYNKLLHSD